MAKKPLFVCFQVEDVYPDLLEVWYDNTLTTEKKFLYNLFKRQEKKLVMAADPFIIQVQVFRL